MSGSAILVTLVSFAALGMAYVIYGRFLARRIFQLDGKRPTPAHTMEDGVDFVPTKKPVLFGHHFASIAGLGPILGPALAVTWGWLPAVLWVVLGCIFLGAVHDLGALTVSLRFRGRSIGDVCRDLIGERARLLFLVVIFFLMSLAMGAFVNAIAALFVQFNPDSIIPSFGLMIVAMAIGLAVYKLRVGLGPATVVGLAAFGGLIVLGVYRPVASYLWFTDEQTTSTLTAAMATAPDNTGNEQQPSLQRPFGAVAATTYLETVGEKEQAANLKAAKDKASIMWIVVLLVYGFFASILPVWLLLQPRDYINSFQLYFALAFLVAGLLVAGVLGASEGKIQAPMVRAQVPGAGALPIFPFLFVTIACGAVSGFHSLVASGTTVRQLDKETDATPIGFGGMLTEGALAILVIMACVAGIGAAAWESGGLYAAWNKGLGPQLSAVVQGGANFLNQVGIPLLFGQAFLAVTIVAFAMTTLDSATRLLRFNVEEIFRSLQLKPLANRYFASLLAVGGIAMFSLEGGKTLWVLFGATNQLLAGLTLLTVSLFLFKLHRPVMYTVAPMVIMLTIAIWAMIQQLLGFLAQQEKDFLLIGVSAGVLVLALWLIVEAGLSFARGRGGLQFDLDESAASDQADTKPAKDAASTS